MLRGIRQSQSWREDLRAASQSKPWLEREKTISQSQPWINEVKVTSQSQPWLEEVRADAKRFYPGISIKGKPHKVLNHSTANNNSASHSNPRLCRNRF